MIKTEEQFDITYVDPSSICAFNRCPAKYLFSRLMGLNLPDSSRIALDYGTDMHVAFPFCYEEEDSCVEVAAEMFYKCWAKRSYGNEDPKRNPAKARASLLDFHQHHKPSTCPYDILPIPEGATIKTIDTISPNEMCFLVDIGGPLALAGRIDLPVRMKANGTLWMSDYKTSSEISARYFANFENSPQALGYTLGGSIALGEDVEGLIIEAVRVSPKNVEYQMYHAFINKHQLEIFVEFANDTAKRILRCNEDKSWPQCSTGCAPYAMFGQPGRFCEYRDLCTIGRWQDMVRYYERLVPFHPFKVKL